MKKIDWRENYLKNRIKGKTVLDMGVGDIRDRFLHNLVSKNSKECIGVELDKNRAKNLQKKGYNIKIGNAETINLKKKFDVVLSGDLIEHLDNVGLFLQNVKRHLKKDGVFILNTPNAYSINFLLRGLFRRGKVSQFEEHTILFTEDLLKETLKRQNFYIKKITYFSHTINAQSLIIKFFTIISKKWHQNIMVEAGIRNEKTK